MYQTKLIMADYKTPGVYIVETNAFPNSPVAVDTAIPVFIGYTEKAESNGKSILNIPTRISSFTEFIIQFGMGFASKFDVVKATDNDDPESCVLINDQKWCVKSQGQIPLLYNSIRLFYANGGGPCYIFPVGIYGGQAAVNIKLEDFIDDKIFEILRKEPEPTLVVMPDVIALGAAAYEAYIRVLHHCNDMQSCFALFDIAQKPNNAAKTVIDEFREQIGTEFLKYGAAYYPWLKTAVVQADEVGFNNIVIACRLENLLPESAAKTIIADYNKQPVTTEATVNLDLALKAASPTYVALLEKIKEKLNVLPPSGAMAGIYTLVDNSRGVWKAPANVSVSMVSAPTVNVSHEEQENLNVDAITGKSINVIRQFPDLGTLVWGARTLDGNSQDWRYINVRRTLIMLEQSLKLATRSYVFEPNDANTWVTVKTMMVNFLTNLWKQGALAGATPDEAFDVQVGLGITMTPNDILDGKMLISVKVAIVRPAEFIVITFQQMMQQS